MTTKLILNYESKSQVLNSKFSGSFSIKIQAVERTFVRSPTGRVTLIGQNMGLNNKDVGVVLIESEIPPAFLVGEETCNRFVANVFSKAKIDNRWIHERIVSEVCQDVISMSRRVEEEDKGVFLIEAEVEIVRETWHDNCISASDYDLEGHLIQPEQDCIICLQELKPSGEKMILKLPCGHNFHKDCLLPWFGRKHSCPTCRDDICNPRPQKQIPRKMIVVSKPNAEHVVMFSSF